MPLMLYNDTQKKRIGVTRVTNDPTDRLATFNLLKKEKYILEEELGETLDWEENPSLD